MAFERAYFEICRAAGCLLRSARYSTVHQGTTPNLKAWRSEDVGVLKKRRFYAPLLIWLSPLIFRLLDAGVRVLPRRAWQEREQRIYREVYQAPVTVDDRSALILPRLPGRTLAALLADPLVDVTTRHWAIERAVVALAEFHRLGFTHADAMADNVMIELETGARWFDFETVHESHRPDTWRRADDLRALLMTCVLRAGPEVSQVIVRAYGDDAVTGRLAKLFASAWRRTLPFHLAQTPLSLPTFRTVGALLRRAVDPDS